jgi:hypothetical protein
MGLANIEFPWAQAGSVKMVMARQVFVVLLPQLFQPRRRRAHNQLHIHDITASCVHFGGGHFYQPYRNVCVQVCTDGQEVPGGWQFN